ncbi:MAG: hypothetical protein HOP10_14210 [Chitinophagaceae bacterium]|nr:hypothetical protein [Chitinophagaceae bacterium]
MKKIAIAITAFFIYSAVQAQNCPVITVTPPLEGVVAGNELVFTAAIKGTSARVTYNWTISAGTILSGQGTSVIKVATKDLSGMSVTATVAIGGLSGNCSSSSSATTDVVAAPEKIIAANYTTPQDLVAVVQKLITEIKLNDHTIPQTAFIYLYSTTDAQLKTMKNTIINTFEKNNISALQYIIADGGKKKTASFEMYNLLPGMQEPKPSK